MTTESQSLLDIGTNCTYCRQLDFLPFTCSDCKLVFCQDHRLREAHACTVAPPPVQLPRPLASTESALLLFPDREANMRRVDDDLAQRRGQRLGAVLDPKKRRALDKFSRFLALQRQKRASASKLIFTSLLGMGKDKSKASDKGWLAMSAKPSPAAILQLRKVAKGDSRIDPADRIHIWCVYVPSGKTSAADDDSALKLDIDTSKKPVFVLKKWPVGRALDSIADTLHISNINNGTVDVGERLHVFGLDESAEPVILKTSDRCLTAFKNGHVIYLVRGLL